MSEKSIVEVRSRISDIISESTDYSASDLQERQGDHLHKDLNIDSLTLLEVALSIDQEFETDFSEEELLGMESIDRAADMVMERLESLKAGAPVG